MSLLMKAVPEESLLSKADSVKVENTQLILFTMISGEFSAHCVDSKSNPEFAGPDGLFDNEEIGRITAAYNALVNAFVPPLEDPVGEFTLFLAAGLKQYNLAPPVLLSSPLDVRVTMPTRMVFHVHCGSWYFTEQRIRLKNGAPADVFSDLNWVGRGNKTFSLVNSCCDVKKPGEKVEHPYSLFVVVAQSLGRLAQATVIEIDPIIENDDSPTQPDD